VLYPFNYGGVAYSPAGAHCTGGRPICDRCIKTMPYLKLTDACLAYGHVPLLDHADFLLDPGERVALIGRNGTGKSSLLAARWRPVPGSGRLDDGEVWVQPGDPGRLRAAGAALRSRVRRVRGGHFRHGRKLDAARRIPRGIAPDGRRRGRSRRAAGRMSALQHELEARGAWAYEAQAERVIDRFGLDPTPVSAHFPAARRSVWRWPRRWRSRQKCCCSTSRPTISTSPPSNGWRTC
jgi:hypothetical protein